MAAGLRRLRLENKFDGDVIYPQDLRLWAINSITFNYLLMETIITWGGLNIYREVETAFILIMKELAYN